MRLLDDVPLSTTSDCPVTVLGLLAALRGRRAQQAAHALAFFLPLNQTFIPASRVLMQWADELETLGVVSSTFEMAEQVIHLICAECGTFSEGEAEGWRA
jgi:hypothetical protein